MAYFVFSQHQKIQLTDQLLTKSQNLSVAMLEWQSSGFKNKNNLKEFKELQPEMRQKNLNTLISHGRPSKKALVEFIKNEKAYQDYLNTNKKTYADKTVMSITGLLLLITLSCIVLMLRIKTQVFVPLKNLTDKMHGFLNNNYSFQFAVPKNNEVGLVEKKFNEMAQTVLHQFKRLRTLDNAKSEFISITSHELRTPLTAISGSLSLLKKIPATDTEKQQKFINMAELETFRLIRLVNDFLDLAKIESHQLPLEKSWQSLKPIIQNCISNIESAQKKSLNFELQCEEDYDVHVDPDRLQQVITNLTSNAIKFAPENSTVTIKVALENKNLYISVIDQGQGISIEDQSRIFDKFTQLGDAHSAKQGTGLGLAITKAIIEEHGGRIGIHSVPGEGTEFYFTITEFRLTEVYQNNKVA
ncbi:MAG: HAMP domain-containing histidine kinase [Bdellovibrionales bacterium]|nr:HAMP domain-containing histidine kinase [Bdellovibrionales bacterium]